MAGPRPDDNYSPVSEVAPSPVMPNDTASVRASAENMGGAIGQGLQGLGRGAQEGASQAFQAEMYKQGLANEHAATMAELDLATRGGEIYNEYKTKQGLDASNSRATYVQKYMQLNDQIRASLPNQAAQKAYDAMATRRLSFTVQDMNGYAATQQRQAYKSGNLAIMKQHQDTAGTIEVADNQGRLGQEKGALIFRVNQAFTDPGFGDYSSVPAKTDPNTGRLVFEDTREGKMAQAEYNNYLDEQLKSFYTNATMILATNPDPNNPGSPTRAVNFLLKNKDFMPASTYRELSGKLNGAFVGEQVRVGTESTGAEWKNKYLEGQASGEHGPSYSNNLGNVTIGGKEFANPATPNDGVILAANNLKDSRYNGQTIEDMSHIWTNTDQAAWLKNVLAGSGLDAKTVIDANNPDQVKKLLKGILMAEKGPEDRKLFNDTVIDQGVDAAFKGEKANLQPGVTQTLTGGYHISEADFYRANEPAMVQQVRDNLAARGYDVTVQDQAERDMRSWIGRRVSDQAGKAKSLYDEIAQSVYNPQSPITNVQDLMNNPQLKDKWIELQGLDTFKAASLEKQIANQATNHSKAYGTSFYDHYNDVLTGKISRIEDLQDYFGTGDKSPLSPLGIRVIQKKLEDMQTPQGQGFAHAESNFLDFARGTITGTKLFPGANPAILDGKFQKYLLTTIPQIEAKKADMIKRGEDPAQMFNPENKDYIGKGIVAPDKGEITKLATSSAFYSPSSTSITPALSNQTPTPSKENYTTIEQVGAAYQSGKMTKDQVQEWVKNHGGWAPKVPGPL